MARYRPWKGGDTVAAVLAYLIGDEVDATAGSLRLAPHLPHGWPALEARGLRLGDETFDVQLEGFAEGQRLRLTRGGSADGGAPTGCWDVEVVLHGTDLFAAAWVGGAGVAVEPTRALHLVGLEVGPEGLEVVAAYAE